MYLRMQARFYHSRLSIFQFMSAIGGGLNQSTQHSILKGKGVYGDGARIFSRLYSYREDRALGSLAAGRVAQSDWRAFGKPASSIYFQLAPQGGIRPPPRHRARLALTLAEREEISRALAEYQSARSIAEPLGRSPSTVSREINRNGG